jgi:hypothetical protein
MSVSILSKWADIHKIYLTRFGMGQIEGLSVSERLYEEIENTVR